MFYQVFVNQISIKGITKFTNIMLTYTLTISSSQNKSLNHTKVNIWE